ncbi:protein translocase subunit SecD [Chitinivibrio alkaliphilus]|nr:protein translocase subunit SecD [Chitinivibrio alkaliphilus]
MAVAFLIPSFRVYRESPEVQQEMLRENPRLGGQILNLGLDIQGGIRMVLGIDTSHATEEEKERIRQDENLMNRVYTVVENRVNALGLTEPIIQIEGNERLIVELPGLSDEEIARDMLSRAAQLNFHLVRSNENQRIQQILDNVDRALAVADHRGAEEDLPADELDELDELDLLDDEPVAEEDLEDLADDEYTATFSDLIYHIDEMSAQAPASAKPRIDSILALPGVQRALQGGVFRWSNIPEIRQQGGRTDTLRAENGSPIYRLYYLTAEPSMGGKDLERAEAMPAHQGIGYQVSLQFNPRGAREFGRVTGRNTGRQLAIVLDNTVYSAPNINERIPSGRASITGNFSREEAQQLAIVLESGDLDAPLVVEQATTVGPSLGRDAVRRALNAALFGLAMVLLFMVFYYKLSGLLAVCALLLNLILVIAIMASFGATLTLPGIAGLILIIGMSVDANVIVFERIKEELVAGKTVSKAIDMGYDRAFVAIMDANITTLFTAFILYQVGSGPIRGFAVTLISGIFVSLFTALVFTKMVYHFVIDYLGKKNALKKLSI